MALLKTAKIHDIRLKFMIYHLTFLYYYKIIKQVTAHGHRPGIAATIVQEEKYERTSIWHRIL